MREDHYKKKSSPHARIINKKIIRNYQMEYKLHFKNSSYHRKQRPDRHKYDNAARQ